MRGKERLHGSYIFILTSFATLRYDGLQTMRERIYANVEAREHEPCFQYRSNLHYNPIRRDLFHVAFNKNTYDICITFIRSIEFCILSTLNIYIFFFQIFNDVCAVIPSYGPDLGKNVIPDESQVE